MDRRDWVWDVPPLLHPIRMARWGWYGKPVIWFPTGGGDYLDCERFLMVRALSPLIEAGRIKLYAADSVSRSWANPDVAPHQKSWFQAQYDEHFLNHIVPAIREDCGGTDQRFAVTGSSLGGYDALVIGAKHPEHVDLTIGMSGTYVLDRRMGAYRDENYYYNMPVQFLPQLGEGPQLEGLRRSNFVLALGSGHAENPDYTNHVSRVLKHKQIPHRVEVWGPGSDHDWPTWRTMLPVFLNRLVRG